MAIKLANGFVIRLKDTARRTVPVKARPKPKHDVS